MLLGAISGGNVLFHRADLSKKHGTEILSMLAYKILTRITHISRVLLQLIY